MHLKTDECKLAGVNEVYEEELLDNPYLSFTFIPLPKPHLLIYTFSQTKLDQCFGKIGTEIVKTKCHHALIYGRSLIHGQGFLFLDWALAFSSRLLLPAFILHLLHTLYSPLILFHSLLSLSMQVSGPLNSPRVPLPLLVASAAASWPSTFSFTYLICQGRQLVGPSFVSWFLRYQRLAPFPCFYFQSPLLSARNKYLLFLIRQFSLNYYNSN